MNNAVRTSLDMDAYWLPFTANSSFKTAPKLFASARGLYYTTLDGREVLDAIAGLWCVNAGHGREPIVEAIRQAAGELDFVSSFQMGHPSAFELCTEIARRVPLAQARVFLSNSGSEAVDTALKIARSYHRARGEAGRTRLVGRKRAYHGMGWGGLSVGGHARHRRDFGPLLPDVDHLSHPYDLAQSAFSRGSPQHGAHFADELSTLFALHDPRTIAAVIVEPVAGSTGVYPPPVGYLQRLRQICDEHGILLIFDEVITGFGRLGAPFAADAFGVVPDIMTCAKGLSNGAAPIGATVVRGEIYDAHMSANSGGIEFPHGYTYSGHPLSCAAALATLSVLDDEGLWTRAGAIAPILEREVHALRGAPHVRDIRNLGLLAAIELEPLAGEPNARAQRCANLCFADGALVRTSGDTLVISPPLTIGEAEIVRLCSTIRTALERTP